MGRCVQRDKPLSSSSDIQSQQPAPPQLARKGGRMRHTCPASRPMPHAVLYLPPSRLTLLPHFVEEPGVILLGAIRAD